MDLETLVCDFLNFQLINSLLKNIQESGCMTSIHLNMMKLEGDGQGGLEPCLAILTPHDHRVEKLVGVLVDNAIILVSVFCKLNL